MKGVLADSQTLTDLTPLPVACSETLLAGYLARFMHDYLRQDPHLALSTHHTPVILARVRSGDALLGICAGRLPPGHGLEARLLLEEPFYLVEGDQRGRKYRSRAAPDPHHGPGQPSNRYLREPLAALGLTPPPWSSTPTRIDRAGQGRYRPCAAAGRPARAGRCRGPRRCPAGPARPLHLVYRPNSLKRARIAQLVQALQAHFQPLAG